MQLECNIHMCVYKYVCMYWVANIFDASLSLEVYVEAISDCLLNFKYSRGSESFNVIDKVMPAYDFALRHGIYYQTRLPLRSIT